MKRTLKYLFAFTLIFITLSVLSAGGVKEGAGVTTEAEKAAVNAQIGGLDSDIWFTKNGNVYTSLKVSDFFESGFGEADIVKISFLDTVLEAPVVPAYSYVDRGTPLIAATLSENGEPTGYVSLAINMGNFGETYGLAHKTTNEDKSWYWRAQNGVEFPVEVKFEMKEKGGYLREYNLHDLKRTNNREDYPELSDEEFANFREITTTGMGKGKLYRSSSPIDSSLGRNTYAESALEDSGVSVIMNLCDSKSGAEAYSGFSDTCYSKENVIYLNLGVDFQAEDFRKGFAEGLRFFIKNPGIYLIHCTEGKDRTGFVAAVLEALTGASYSEIAEDYMKTYENYYKVEKGTDKYNDILSGNIVKTLSEAFSLTDLESADLEAAAVSYIKSLGLTDEEINTLKENLK